MSLEVLQHIPKLGYNIIQIANIMVEVVGKKKLLRYIIYCFAQALQVLEALPIKLNLLIKVA
jgi:hypothetical protein